MAANKDLPEEFNSTLPAIFIFSIALLIVILGFIYLFPKIKDEFKKKDLLQIFEGHKLNKITLALDSYAGYTIAQSGLLKNKLRAEGIHLNVVNEPDFFKRVKLFSEGKVDLICITIDAYIKNGVKFMKGSLFPGPVVVVISESRGADAIFVGKKSAIKTINDLNAENITVALTPDSPSEFLSCILMENFGIEKWKENDNWRIETSGSEEARKLLENGTVQASIVWEPDVNKLVENDNYISLHDSGKNRRMILDVLIASPELVKEKVILTKYLKNYFNCVDEFSVNDDLFIKEIKRFTGQSKKASAAMMQRIEWFDLYANAVNLFGLRDIPNVDYEDISDFLIECVENVSYLLSKTGFLTEEFYNIIVQNPFNILNTSFINKLSEKGVTKTINFKRNYTKIVKNDFLSMPVVGSLKIDPIEFKTGESKLSRSGYKTVDKIARILKTYEYRIIIEGHTESGDPGIILPLSQDRADAVKKVLIHTHSISENRILSIGYGDNKPLLKGTMSRREWQRKLRRVEIVLVSEE